MAVRNVNIDKLIQIAQIKIILNKTKKKKKATSPITCPNIGVPTLLTRIHQVRIASPWKEALHTFGSHKLLQG